MIWKYIERVLNASIQSLIHNVNSFAIRNDELFENFSSVQVNWIIYSYQLFSQPCKLFSVG